MKRKHMVSYILMPLLIQWGLALGIPYLLLFFGGSIWEDAIALTSLISCVTIPCAGALYIRDRRRKPEESGAALTGSICLQLSVQAATLCMALNLCITLLQIQRFSLGYQTVADAIYEVSWGEQLLCTVVLAPIAEELIYRGLLYARIREWTSPFWATLLAAGIFGICHGNLVQFLFAFGIGVFLCRVYETYQKLPVIIGLHMVVNLTSLLLTWMATQIA